MPAGHGWERLILGFGPLGGAAFVSHRVSLPVSVYPHDARGGVVAKFPLHRIRSYTGKVIFMIIGQPYTPSLGEVDVHTKGAAPRTLSLGRNGEFYVDDLDPGTYRASLRIGKVGCDFNHVLPATDAAVNDLGVIECSR